MNHNTYETSLGSQMQPALSRASAGPFFSLHRQSKGPPISYLKTCLIFHLFWWEDLSFLSADPAISVWKQSLVLPCMA